MKLETVSIAEQLQKLAVRKNSLTWPNLARNSMPCSGLSLQA